jgi:hypothetical protein
LLQLSTDKAKHAVLILMMRKSMNRTVHERNSEEKVKVTNNNID